MGELAEPSILRVIKGGGGGGGGGGGVDHVSQKITALSQFTKKTTLTIIHTSRKIKVKNILKRSWFMAAMAITIFTS